MMDLGLTDKLQLSRARLEGWGWRQPGTGSRGLQRHDLRSRRAGLAEATADLRRVGGDSRVMAVQADLATEKGVADVVMRTVEVLRRLDVLVNNVGSGGDDHH
jgi:NAD(P)-dependent dehydrogenase (short-subunit alcohol dehydrogenase family)